MRSIVRWAVRNGPAMNTLMLTVLVVGALSMAWMRREVFPEFELEMILVTVPYPGASPEEVAEGVCQRMEEAVRSIDGIKKQTSVAAEGSGSLILELEANVEDVQEILNEVRSEIDRIPSFPELAEDPQVTQVTIRTPAIRVGIIGPDSTSARAELDLRDLTEQIRNEILQLPSVSQANIVGARPFQIDIEIPEKALREYGLSLQEVARIVRRENLELPGGKMITDSQQVLLRGKNKRLLGKDIEEIPIVTKENGVVLTLGELGTVRDEFTDVTSINRIDGRPGLAISVDRTATEDVIQIVDEVKKYVADRELPPGYEFRLWRDRSVDVRDRMELLSRNGLQGLLLVFLVLAVFLEIRLAFWVALGIPISILGACAVLYYGGQTMNMLSMFAFLMALGIVVDDAIVIGENIYEHRQRGKKIIPAAIDGTIEVFPSVLASVATTIIAFTPLMFVAGIMGKFIAVLPVAVIAMLVISLIESMIILPCHLGHQHSERPSLLTRLSSRVEELDGWTAVAARTAVGLLRIVAGIVYGFFAQIGALFGAINRGADRALGAVIDRYYAPGLRAAVSHPAITTSIAAAILIIALGSVVSLRFTGDGVKRESGIIPFVIMPKLDNRTIEARIVFPDGTPSEQTAAATERLAAAFRAVDREVAPEDSSYAIVIHRAVGESAASTEAGNKSRQSGSHVGVVSVELIEAAERSLTSFELINRWREEAGEIAGAETLVFNSPNIGPGGTPIEFKLLADPSEIEQLEAAVERCKEKLRTYKGVFDVQDDARPGKWEYQITVKDDARALGVPLADIAETVRASYYGEEVMRLQRGRHEVKLMVRYPREDRHTLATFEDIRVRTGDGLERPLTELAEVDVRRGYSEINRVDQLRSITVSADVDDDVANSREVLADMRRDFMPALLAEHPDVSVRWEGQQEQTSESVQSMLIGFVIALGAMFCLLTVEFRSYFQPLLILAIIPFGAVGAIVGHWLLGLPLTLFSLFGLVALTGVVVNDSIVLIDFINHRIADGMPLKEALVDAGRRRFRPVLLTSVTTIAGLLPILTETSFQAQILIPMATSLTFGLALATVLVLLMVPTFYYIYGRVVMIEGPEGVPATGDQALSMESS